MPLNLVNVEPGDARVAVIDLIHATTGVSPRRGPALRTAVMDLADGFAAYQNGFRCRINLTTGEREISEPRAWVEYFFNQNNAAERTQYVELPQLPENSTPEAEGARVRLLKLLRKGDLLQYPRSAGVSHVSIVHADRATCTNPNSRSSCTYEIVHAYVVTPYVYTRHIHSSYSVEVSGKK